MTVWLARDRRTYRYLFYLKGKAYRGNTKVCSREAAVEVEDAVRRKLRARPSRARIAKRLQVFGNAEPLAPPDYAELVYQIVRAESSRRELNGLVYFIGAERTKSVKIGYATNVRRRLHNLQIGCPTPLKTLAVIPGSIRIERLLHWAFADAKMAGEWFRLTEDLQLLIDRCVIRKASESTPEPQALSTSDTATEST